MSDEVDKPDDAQPTGTDPAPTTAEPQAKTFTQEQVDAIVQREKGKTERRVRKEMETPKPKSETPAAPAPAIDPVVADLKAKYEFAEALNDLDWKPSKDDRETLRDMFLAKGVDAMERLANRLKPAPAAAPTAKTDPAPAAPSPAVASPIKTPGAPAAVPTDPADIPWSQLTQADFDRMKSEGTAMDYLERQGRGSNPHPFGGKRARVLRGMPK